MTYINWGIVCNSLNPFCFQVSVDVFKGFPDEDSIVNYTLNQAYQDNVSVFASESLLSTYNALLKYLHLLTLWHLMTTNPFFSIKNLKNIRMHDIQKV